METNEKKLLSIFLAGLIFIGLALFRGCSLRPISSSPSPTVTQTITPPPYLGFNAVTVLNADCFDWSYQILTNIEPIEIVQALGRNINNTWIMVRWPKFTTACWVEASLLKPDNYNIDDLPIIKALFPPLSTQTPGPNNITTNTSFFSTDATLTLTPSKTKTAIFKTNTPTLTKDKTNHNPNDTSTITVTSTVTSTPSKTDTPTPTFTPSKTDTPTPTFTPSKTDTPTDTLTPICNKPASSPKLSAGNNGPNVNLSWSSVQGATTYEVFVSENDGPATSLGTTTKTDMKHSIQKSTKQAYYVVPINSCGNGPDSNIEVITR